VPKHACFIAIAVLAALAAALHWTERADLHWLDLQFRLLRAVAAEPNVPDVVVVGVDEETTATLAEPVTLWHKHLAAFLRAMALAGPSVVGIDVVLPERSYESVLPGGDRALLQGIVEARRAFPLILALTVDASGKPRSILPAFATVAGESGLGYALWPLDTDGAVRRFDERLGEGGAAVPTLVGQMLRRVGVQPGSGIIDFARGEPFRYVPLQRVLEWESGRRVAELKQAFGGRPVLLGVVLPFTDRLPAPLPLLAGEPESSRVPGVLFHAQALRNLLGRGLVAEVATAAVVALAVALAALWFVPMRSGYAVAASVALALALAAVSTWLLRQGGYLPVVTPALAGVLAIGGRSGYETVLQLRERRRLRGAFAGYVSPGVMDEILAGRLQPQLGGARQFVCVLFSDIRGYTSRSETMAPEEVIAFLNRYFERVVDLIHAHDGTVASFMGDGIMAIFGAPKAIANPCRAAFAAAREMLANVAQLNAQLRGEGQPPIEIGVGLHAGDALVGHVGSSRRHDYSAIGDVTNVASRIEGLTKDVGYRLVCSHVVAAEVIPDAPLVALGAQAIKGHSPVEVYGLEKI